MDGMLLFVENLANLDGNRTPMNLVNSKTLKIIFYVNPIVELSQAENVPSVCR
jgi:hypothetical protein